MFNLFKKKEEALPALQGIDDASIVAPADGKLIDVTTVSDPMFAQKMMGESTAFEYDKDRVTICSPANGKLSVVFPTGHAFGITMHDGTELLIHIGIDTVNSKGEGFRLCGKKQGEEIKAGDPVVTVDLKKLRQKYEMPVMLIVTGGSERKITFRDPCTVSRGDSVII